MLEDGVGGSDDHAGGDVDVLDFGWDGDVGGVGGEYAVDEVLFDIAILILVWVLVGAGGGLSKHESVFAAPAKRCYSDFQPVRTSGKWRRRGPE